MDDSFVTEILGFVCEKPSPPNERVLATVLFTDIVGSTELLSSQGDERWRRQLDVHDKLVDGLLSKYGSARKAHRGRDFRNLRWSHQGRTVRVGAVSGACDTWYTHPRRHSHRRMRTPRR
jgi:class 3 adenylate cyclase